ncbi:MAG: DUF4160 domain-containing protein [Methyloceanibacter sp.]|uniref:DUF4160 domain-containing protein n=1 Tax=Methyloceanibacter sp. TaxID=1965321 RepID=UPI003D6CEFD6
MSPTVLREKGYRFFFFSREEPRCRIHVETPGGEAKYWLEPRLALARNHGLSSKQLAEAEAIIEANHGRIIRAWHEHFGS